MLVGLALLVPGVTKPILILDATVDKAALVELGKQLIASQPNVPQLIVSMSEQIIDGLEIEGELNAFSKTRSIVSAVDELWSADRYLVAFLIALFSVIVPVVKSVLLLLAFAMPNQSLSKPAMRFSAGISKWSMADVFAIALVVTFLAANATQSTEELFTLHANLGEGFYYFLAYCLLSVASAQLMTYGGENNGARPKLTQR